MDYFYKIIILFFYVVISDYHELLELSHKGKIDKNTANYVKLNYL